MLIFTQEGDFSKDLRFTEWDIGFVGSALDDRGEGAIDFLRDNCEKLIEVNYDPVEMELAIGEKSYIVDDLDTYFETIGNKRVVIESTTLNFSEILLLLSGIKSVVGHATVLYIEPKSYERKRTVTFVEKRQFELSGETPVYKPIPGFAGLLNEDIVQKVVFMTGYESERIDRAFEENSIVPQNSSLLFGVPAFKAGWEMNAFANNVRAIKDLSIEGEIYFAGANNTCAVYDVIDTVYNSLDETEELYLAPVGTKPAGIATAIFAIGHPDVSILYDHPVKKEKRTSEIAKWHLLDITLDHE